MFHMSTTSRGGADGEPAASQRACKWHRGTTATQRCDEAPGGGGRRAEHHALPACGPQSGGAAMDRGIGLGGGAASPRSLRARPPPAAIPHNHRHCETEPSASNSAGGLPREAAATRPDSGGGGRHARTSGIAATLTNTVLADFSVLLQRRAQKLSTPAAGTEFRPRVGKIWPSWANACPMSAEFGQTYANLEHASDVVHTLATR